MPPSTLNRALSLYLDIAATPSPDLMCDWVQFTSDETEKEAILKLCEDSQLFQEWRGKCPNLLDFLRVFPSLKMPAASLVASLSKLIPRAYRQSDQMWLFYGQNLAIF